MKTSKLINLSHRLLPLTGLFATLTIILLLSPQDIKAEEKTIIYDPTSNIGFDGWKEYKKNNEYVTLTTNNTNTGDNAISTNSDGDLRIPGKAQSQAKSVTFALPANTYIHSYSFTAKCDNGYDGNLNKAYAYFRINADVTTSTYDLRLYKGNNSGTLTKDIYNSQNLTISIRNEDYFWTDIYGAINNVKLTLWIPEVKTGVAQNVPINYEMERVEKNQTASHTFDFDVSEAINMTDFDIKVSNVDGKGNADARIISLENNKLKVEVTYLSNYDENYSFDIELSSTNTKNTATHEVHIIGSVGNVTVANQLRFLDTFSETQYINSRIEKENQIYTNSPATITYKTDKTNVAYYSGDTEGLLLINKEGLTDDKVTLTISQAEYETPDHIKYEAKTITKTIKVKKRTPEFVFNPCRTETDKDYPGILYTGTNYRDFIKLINDPNNTLVNRLSYKSDDDELLVVESSLSGASATTKNSVGNVNLTITTVNEDPEWEPVNILREITIAKNPVVVPFCLEDVPDDIINNRSFIKLVEGSVGTYTINNNQLTLGTGNQNTNVNVKVIITFEGHPEYLKFNYARFVNNNANSLKIYQGKNGEFGSDALLATYTNAQTGDKNILLDESTNCLMITWSGYGYAYLSDFCITAASNFMILNQKGGIDISEFGLQLQEGQDGTKGTFVISHSNMEKITLENNNPNFQITPKDLDYKDGLGINASGDITINAEYKYTGTGETTTTLTYTGTTVGGEQIEKKIFLSITHPNHYLKMSAFANPTDGGTVYMSEEDNGTFADESYIIFQCKGEDEADNDTRTAYYYAKADEANGYFFLGWKTDPLNEDYVSRATKYLATATAHSTNLGKPTEYTLYAIFSNSYADKSVQIISATNGSCEPEIKTIGGQAIGSVSFKTLYVRNFNQQFSKDNGANTWSSDDFTASIADDATGWEITGVTFNENTSTVIVSVKFTESAPHQNGMISCNVLLTNKKEKTDTDYSSYQATATAIVDLPYKFSMSENYHYFGNVEIVGEGDNCSEVWTTKVATIEKITTSSNTFRYQISDNDNFKVEQTPGDFGYSVFNITFCPKEEGDYSATLTITAHSEIGEIVETITLEGKSKIVTEATITIYDENDNFVTDSKAVKENPTSFYLYPTIYLNAGEEVNHIFSYELEGLDKKDLAYSEPEVGEANIFKITKYTPDGYRFDGYFDVSCQPTEVGDYHRMLTITGKSKVKTEEGTTITARIQFNATCVFAPFEVEFKADESDKTKVTVSWHKQINADETSVYCNDVEISQEQITCGSDGICSYTMTGVQDNTEYRFYFVLKNKVSGKIWEQIDYYLAGDAISKETCHDLTNLGISEGINVCAAFDDDGTALMDYLYIFDAGPEKGVDAKRCYVYRKFDNRTYSYYRVYEPNKEVVLTTSESNKKYYFTGNCYDKSAANNAFTGGSDQNKNGLITITATSGDFYIDNLHIETASRVTNSYDVLNTTSILQVLNFLGSNPIISGHASVFTVESSKTANINFHIKGESTLKASSGMRFNIIANTSIKSIQQIGKQCTSAPICNHSRTVAVHFTFDDTWADAAKTRTNGMLHLPGWSGATSNCGSIDVGNNGSSVTFNGGQYQLQSTYSPSDQYANSLPISYRFAEMSGVYLYAFAGDATDFKIVINDGTFTTYEGPQAGVDKEIYTTTKDLRLSNESQVNGGTFNLGEKGRVYSCLSATSEGTNPINKAGQTLCRAEIVNNSLEFASFKQRENGTVEISTTIDGNKHSYSEEFKDYGKESLNSYMCKSDNENYGDTEVEMVHVYLPIGKNVKCEIKQVNDVYNWQTIIPRIGYDSYGLGGDTKIITTKNSTGKNDVKVNYFAYIEVDQNIYNNYQEGFKTQRAYATNEDGDDFTISEASYLVLFFNSNRWYNFCAPFDITDFYVVEWTGQELKAEDITNANKDAKQKQFLKDQADRNASLLQDLATLIIPRTSYVGAPNTLENLMKRTVKVDDYSYSSNCKSILPYDGTNGDKSSFYAYHIGEEQYLPDFNHTYKGLWTKTLGDSEFRNCYTLVDNGNDVWLKQGEVYDLFFPSSAKTNYWDGKFIILKGKGEQILTSSKSLTANVNSLSMDNPWFDSTADGMYELSNYQGGVVAKFQGNYSFAQQEIGGIIYESDENSNYGRKQSSNKNHIIEPTRAFLVLDESVANSIAKISRNGAITYTDETTDVTTPIIADNLLIAWGTTNTINIESYADQTISIYNAAGMQYWSGKIKENQYLTLPAQAGVYIIRAAETSVKIVVE